MAPKYARLELYIEEEVRANKKIRILFRGSRGSSDLQLSP
jgi:hypothetical protein